MRYFPLWVLFELLAVTVITVSPGGCWLLDERQGEPTDPRSKVGWRRRESPSATIRDRRLTRNSKTSCSSLIVLPITLLLNRETQNKFKCYYRYGFPSEKKHQNKRLLSQSHEFTIDFVITGNNQANVDENETVELQNDGFLGNFRSIQLGENSAIKNQVIQRNFEDIIRK